MSFVKTVGSGEGLMRKLNEDTEKFNKFFCLKIIGKVYPLYDCLINSPILNGYVYF